MGWEQRGNRSYYYRKERQGSRVRSVYIGRGVVADLYEVMLKETQAQCSERRDKLQQERAGLESFYVDLEALRRLTGAITDAVLIAAGFHQHKRQWRRRRR